MEYRVLISPEGRQVNCYAWYMTSNMWEFYQLDAPDKSSPITFGLVMGDEQELGSFSLEEIAPYIIRKAKGKELLQLLPPTGWRWSDASG